MFCKIVKGDVSADFVYQDDEIAVFTNIAPKAPVHLLLIPKVHVEDLDELDDQLLLKLKNKVIDLVKEKGLKTKGYRLTINGGAAKAVPHVHFHLLGEVAVEREV